MILIFGPLASPRIEPVIETFARSSAEERTVDPSTTSTGWRSTESPSTSSTSTTSPTATLYCLPPVFTIAYIGWYSWLFDVLGLTVTGPGCSFGLILPAQRTNLRAAELAGRANERTARR